jgi:uncharacterized protein YbcI
MNTEFEMNFVDAMKQAQTEVAKRGDKAAKQQFAKLIGKKQVELSSSEKSFVIRWYLRSFEG